MKASKCMHTYTRIASAVIYAGMFCLMHQVLLAPPGVSEATSILRMDVAQQVDRADLIFKGRLVRTEYVLSQDGRMPYTLATFAVDKVLKGATESNLMTLRFLGGKTDTEEVRIVGIPSFKTGESYLLFVKDNGIVACPVLGWGQGTLRFSIHKNTRTEVLVTETEAVVRGIESGRFVHDAPLHAVEPGMEYVDMPQAGVISHPDTAAPTTLTQPAPAATQKAPIPETVVPAEDVLQQLRSFIQLRAATTASFRSGKTVRSVSRQDIPPDVGGSAGNSTAPPVGPR